MRRHKQPTDRHPQIFGLDDLLVGVIGGSIIDAIAGHSANQAAIASANANRDIALHGHEYEVRDLQRAGLNPMLSFRGSGTAISGGAMPNIQPIAQNTAQKITSALLASKETQAISAGIDKTKAEERLAIQNAATSGAEERKRNIEALILEGYGGKELEAKIKLMDQQRVTSASEEARNTQMTANLKAELPKIEAEIQRIGAETTRIGADTELTRMKKRTEEFAGDIEELNAYEKANVTPHLIAMIAREREKIDMSMAGAQNRQTAQESGFARLLALLGFSQAESTNILSDAIALTQRSKAK